MKRFFLLICLLFIFGLLKSWAHQDSLVFVIETAILNENTEFAKQEIEKLDDDTYSEVKGILKRVTSANNISYEDYKTFVTHVSSEKMVEAPILSAYIQKNVEEPTNKDQINYAYVVIKWVEISWLMNDSHLEIAAEQQAKLEKYITKFDLDDIEVKRANILAASYHLVMCQISKDGERGTKMCLENETVAKEIKDTNLIIMSLFFYADFMIGKGDIDEFIRVSEESLELDSKLENRSFYYSPTALHLIDAYLYKGGKEKEALMLLNTLYDDPNLRKQTYSYYPQYLASIAIPSPKSDAIFQKFGVDDLNGFANKLFRISEDEVNARELYYVLWKLSEMFANHEQLEVALEYSLRANEELRKTYSQELSKSLASYETNLLKQQQESELVIEQEKTKMYFIISVLTGFVAILTFLLLILRKKKERELVLKNHKITLQRDEIRKKNAEKAILLKEIHHRVKNNFQVVSSLLELQSAGIEDKKAKAMAIEGKNRINSMALIHKKLYENDDLQMFFDEYIRKLVSDLSSIYGESDNCELRINVPHLAFDVDTAIPLGLVVNELVTNVLKYGLTHEEPILEVSIKKTDSDLYVLHVGDNGAGLPANLDINKLKSLGLQLVKGLARQLQGKLEYTDKNGAHFYVSFKDTHSRAAVD
jgi:two-component sensor histidine kinase